MRTGPSTSYPIVSSIYNNQAFTAFEIIKGESYEWYHFWYQGRNDTWCAADYTTPIKDSKLRLVAGWLVYWDWSTGNESFTSNIKLFDEVSPYWYKAQTDGSLYAYSGAGNESFVRQAHAEEVKVVPLITNEYNKTLINIILSNSTTLENHVATIVSTVLSNNYDGIDIDYEGLYASDKDNFTLFISKLAKQLHQKNKLLSVCLQAKWLMLANGTVLVLMITKI